VFKFLCVNCQVSSEFFLKKFSSPYFKTPFVLQGQVEPRSRQEVEQEEESRFFGFRPWRHPQEEKGKIIISQ
jgi:hypothetical protein